MSDIRIPTSQLPPLPDSLLSPQNLFVPTSVRDPEGNFYAQSYRLALSSLLAAFEAALPSVVNGREVELRSVPAAGGQNLQWKYSDEGVWTPLAFIPDGADGEGAGNLPRQIEIRTVDVTGGRRLEWKYDTQVTWTVLDVILDGADGVSEITYLSGANLTLPAPGSSFSFSKAPEGVLRVLGYYGFGGVEGVFQVLTVGASLVQATNIDIAGATLVPANTIITSAGKPGTGSGGPGPGGPSAVGAFTNLDVSSPLAAPSYGAVFTFSVLQPQALLLLGVYQFGNEGGVFRVNSKTGSTISATNISIVPGSTIANGTIIGPAGPPGEDATITFQGSSELVGATSVVLGTENSDWAVTVPNPAPNTTVSGTAPQSSTTFVVGRGITSLGNLLPTWSSGKFLVFSSTDTSVDSFSIDPILSAALEYRVVVTANCRTALGGLSTKTLRVFFNEEEALDEVVPYSTTTWSTFTSEWLSIPPHVQLNVRFELGADTPIGQTLFLGPYEIHARVPSGGLDAVTYLDQPGGVAIPILGQTFTFTKVNSGLLGVGAFYSFSGEEGAFQVISVAGRLITALNTTIILEPTIPDRTLIVPTGPPGPPGPGGDMMKAEYDPTDSGRVDFAGNIDGIDSVGASQYYGTNETGDPGFHDLPQGTDASALTTGTLDSARLDADVTLQGNTFNGPEQLVLVNEDGELPALSAVNLTDVPVRTLQQVLTADATIASAWPNRLYLDPGGADRNVTINIPTHSEVWLTHVGSADVLALYEGATYITDLLPNDICILTKTSVELHVTIL